MESASMRPPSSLAARRWSFAGVMTTQLRNGHNFHVEVPISSWIYVHQVVYMDGLSHWWLELSVTVAPRVVAQRRAVVMVFVTTAEEVLLGSWLSQQGRCFTWHTRCVDEWIALACVLGLWRPSTFSWVDQKWQIIGLTVAMLGMGMTLILDDMKGCQADVQKIAHWVFCSSTR